MLLILNFIAFIISIETEASLLALAKSIYYYGLLHDSAQNALMESVTPYTALQLLYLILHGLQADPLTIVYFVQFFRPKKWKPTFF